MGIYNDMFGVPIVTHFANLVGNTIIITVGDVPC